MATIIVEDGTGANPAANSYATEAELSTFATDRGVTLTGDPSTLLIVAMDYVEAFRWQFSGQRTSADQPLQWPRSGVYVDGYPVGSDEIPIDLKRAQMQAAIESDTQDVQPNTAGAIKREKVDVLEVEYEQGGSLLAPQFPKVDAYLDALLGDSGASGFIRFGATR